MSTERTSAITLDHPRRLDFWSRVAVGSEGECWDWARGKTARGYGKLTIPSRITGAPGAPIAFYAHRVAYALGRGEMPAPGEVLDHLCRNTSCCNPNHIEGVTQRLNARRAVEPMTPIERSRNGGDSWVVRFAEFDPIAGERRYRGITFRDPEMANAVARAIHAYRMTGGDRVA